MDKTLFTLLLIVLLVSGGSHPTCSSLSLTVEEGEDVSLWCGLVPSVNLMNYTVEVTRTDLSQFVLLYRDRRVLLDVHMEQYRHRTTLDLRGLIRGNITVQISSVKMSDRGDYTCLIPRLKARCIITLHLVEERNHVSAAPPLENNSTSNQPGKGAVAAIVVAVVLCVLLPLGALLLVDFIRLRSGRNSLTGNCVTRCRGQKDQDPFTGYRAATGSGPVYIQDMVQPDEMRGTGPCELRAETSPHLEH
ncbi:myelin-oligodendrocyte glycoprotein-like [Pleuronectes platessa]|uniref:myelin-oligodendrocyte glycoprotein-like n=1 Tax=Pleuronectes platessa TaxID=8262 RepID=UPI00232A7044|nr:myelin-oligodendrocyte glycoprotein-like [Pleuronectes platessa]XP_053274156.1 myelin-oligodendrocyte glycoprotein-like [Pleuronectes platessa]XP_053274157.1 myelin-oligodendrocyte glycoprotein-like [Pleuronectes platessa]XP_053274158.1 myelin-oligodendrocyte glycoprotein-like [Pleuronectes platessa]XP_053274160.1 myelin-oligodendrocyte glycoprotein-like [Pleuronectes platessa]XP_053274161.1 myelin-oligodendrocyte glycoprotein-like [Pleuronectes platessa]XP_053274162.1 myelin-oligodendrocy